MLALWSPVSPPLYWSQGGDRFWRPQAEGGGCTGPIPAPRIDDGTTGTEDGSIVDEVQGTWPATSARQWS